MSRQQSSDLRARWDSQATAFVLDALLRGRPASPYGTHDGRVDVRGLTIEESARTKVTDELARLDTIYEFSRISLRDVDFSHSTLSEWRVMDSKFENCVFEFSRLPGFRAYSAVFRKCNFVSADLRGASLGARIKDRKPGGLYENCDFTGANLQRLGTDPGHFVNCNFQFTKWKNTRFLSTVLDSCDFRNATIEGSFFDGRSFRDNAPVGLGENKLKDCDFSTAILIDTSFLAIDFRNCVPPSGEEYALVDQYPRRAQDALGYLKTLSGPEASIAAAVLDADMQSIRLLPGEAVGLIQFEHYPGGRELVEKAFGLVQ